MEQSGIFDPEPLHATDQMRGGIYTGIVEAAMSRFRFYGDGGFGDAFGSSTSGFRVAMVPEPPTFAMAALGGLGLLASRRRWSRRQNAPAERLSSLFLQGERA